MDKQTKINLLIDVIKGKADRSILKTNKLLYRRNVDHNSMFEINGNPATLKNVFALYYTDPNFETKIIQL